MKMFILNIFTFSLILIKLTKCTDSKDFQLHLFDESTQARCLDGSKYGVWHSKGFDEGNKNIIINFWGGGLCTGRTHEAFYEDCLERSKGELGTSKDYEQTKSFSSGFLNVEQNKNPNFFNWNKFDFPYCDGSFHQGHITDPVDIHGTQLFFRGYQNVLNGLNFVISKIDLTKVEKVVITGCSTGGYATLSWVNYIQDKFFNINPHLKFYGIADSGFFIDYFNFKTKDRDYFITNKIFHEILNKEQAPLSEECLKELPEDKQDRCLFPQYFVKHIKVPLLILQSSYDSSNLYETVGLECVDNDTLRDCNEEEQINSQVFKTYQNYLIKKEVKRNPNISAFLISCVTHCFEDKMDSDDWQIPENSGFTIYKAVEEFLKNPNKKLVRIDEVEWPENQRCANA